MSTDCENLMFLYLDPHSLLGTAPPSICKSKDTTRTIHNQRSDTAFSRTNYNQYTLYNQHPNHPYIALEERAPEYVVQNNCEDRGSRPEACLIAPDSAVHAIISFLVSVSLLFTLHLFLGIPSYLGDANK